MSVFLSVRPIVLSQARSTMWSFTTLFSNNRKVQRARPLGGLEQSQGDQFGFLLAVKNPRNRRRCPLLAAQHGLEAFFHKLLTHPVGRTAAQHISLPKSASQP